MSTKIRETLERRGLKRDVYIDYFLSLGGRFMDEERIAGSDWQVVLSPEQEIGERIRLPVVYITFEADTETIQHFIHKFRMHFLSAGG